MSDTSKPNRSIDDVKRLARNIGSNLAAVASGTKFASSNRPAWDLTETKGTDARAREAGMVTAGQFARALGISFTSFMTCGVIPAPDVSSHPNPRIWSVGVVNRYLKLMGRPLLPEPGTTSR